MDSFHLKNFDILKLVNVIKARCSRNKVELSPHSENISLIGFVSGKMVFRMNKSEEKVDVNSPSTIIKNNSNEYLEGKDTEESHSKNVISKNINSQEMKVQKIIKDPTGRKFIQLTNGQKLQIVKPSTNSTLNQIQGKLMHRLPPIVPNLAPPINKLDVRTEISVQTSSMGSNTQQNTNKTVKIPSNIIPKLTGKIISINKNEGFQNLSLIMKEVGGSLGGTIRVLSRNNSTALGNPLVSETVVYEPTHTDINKDTSLDKMETSQCSCKGNKKLVTSSTNTESVKLVDKGVQTDNFLGDESKGDSEVEAISELYNSGVIIGDDVNMGHGPPSIFTSNEKNLKMKFFHDLQRCLKFESGNLPIHRGVIQHDIQEVKHQCVVLKARKAGINIPNITNHTPLQLAVINDVNADIVKVLLENDADLSVLDIEGNSVLHLAVEHNRNDLVKIFLEKLGTNGLDINHFNYDGLTPLMMCAFHVDRIDMAEQFLKMKAELNLRDLKSGRTAIFHAAESHNAPMVGLLLDYGADTKIRNFFGTSVHDAMFELDDIPKEIKYPILGRDLKVHEKRKLHQQNARRETFKRKKLEIVSTIQKLESKARINTGNMKN